MRVRRLRQRVAHDESGLTLIELLVTLTILGILLAIAVPSYLGYERRASTTTAKANLRAALPAVEGYYHDHATYDEASMTVAALRGYDQGMSPGISVISGSDHTYCIRSTHRDATVFKNGPGAAVTDVACT
jgi:type IV pilus assembly protein PilA